MKRFGQNLETNNSHIGETPSQKFGNPDLMNTWSVAAGLSENPGLTAPEKTHIPKTFSVNPCCKGLCAQCAYSAHTFTSQKIWNKEEP